MAKTVDLKDIPAELEELLTEFLHANYDVRQKAVQAGAEVLVTALESATPRDTGEMAQSWQIKSKYPDHRYVGNSRTAHGTVKRKRGGKTDAQSNVPLSNVLEYAQNSKHQLFVKQTFDQTEPQIYAAIKNTINNSGGN
ncbi:MAG: HK97 gp10 family phage protein [Lachnospiraceae bacterium]|nr:HK97 gp10 family phage protein [Lachnospiraceae bacterium]